jgi:hypothetical protein
VWESEYSVEAQLGPESVWRVWADFQNAGFWIISSPSADMSTCRRAAGRSRRLRRGKRG